VLGRYHCNEYAAETENKSRLVNYACEADRRNEAGLGSYLIADKPFALSESAFARSEDSSRVSTSGAATERRR